MSEPTGRRNAAVRPGRPARGSTTGQPIMVLFDLLGRRWALRILWELALRPRQTFRELQVACGDISASVLRDRLRELREVGIIERTDPGYALSRSGADLVRTLDPLNRWARRWASLLEDA